MTTTHALRASVWIPISEPLETFSSRLGQAMQGLKFADDPMDRYDEVPAFVAECAGMEFVLFGVPLGEVGDEYELRFRCETDLPIAKLLEQDAGGFVQKFVHEKALNDRGFMDFSEELAHLLIQHGIAGCRPTSPVM